MHDGEIVAATAAGEPAGLAAAYDYYAPGLYAYCWALLGEPAAAAAAVQNTYLIAAVKLGGLRDPDRLRPWLYAMARNECFRRVRARGLSVPPGTAEQVTTDDPNTAVGPERQELRDLVVDALSGLNPADREVIELNLRHVLEGDDLADALGASRNQARALVSRARAQFERSLGALLVARTGRVGCYALDDILAGWDGELTILLRKRVNRHIQRCEVCFDHQRRELSPAMLLSMLPMVAIPAALRDHVLRLVGDVSPIAAGHRELLARRAEPFDRSGFPKPIAPPRRVYGVPALTVAAGVAVAAAILLGVGTVAVLGLVHHKGPATASAAALGPAPIGKAPLSATSHRGVSPSPSHPGSHARQPGRAIAVPATPTTPARPGSPGPSSPAPGHPQPSPTQSPSPSPGTLAVSPSSVTLSQGAGGPYTGSFTITAQGGGAVSYSIADPAPAGDLAVSPSSGSLSAGQSVTVSVTVSSDVGLAFETDLTVNPGGLVVAIFYPPAGG